MDIEKIKARAQEKFAQQKIMAKLREQDAAKDIARNTTELAGELGVTRQWVNKLKKIKGAPVTLSVSEWRAFMATNKEPVDDDMVELKKRKLQAEVEKKELENAVIKGEYIQRAHVDEIMTETLTRARQTVNQAMVNEWPLGFHGLEIDEIREKCKARFGEFLMILTRALERFKEIDK